MATLTDRWRSWSAPMQPLFRGHILELDGLRCAGLSLVMIDHFWMPGMSSFIFQLGNLGWIAMDSFFVMSGFLITGILLDSREKPNYFTTYYARRSLRIFPLYYLMLLIWYVLMRYTDHGINLRNMQHNYGSPLWYVFYLGNLVSIFGIDIQKLRTMPILAYAPLWSLQIEEQFYLLFPFAVAWMSRKNLTRLLVAAVVVSPALRVAAYFWQPTNMYLQYTELPCHCEGIALGGLMAIRIRCGEWKISRVALSAWTAILLGATIAGSLISTWGVHTQAWGTVWNRLAGYSLSSAGCACLVLWLICFRNTPVTWLLRLPPITYLGRICYGIYLLHPLAFYIVMELGKKRFVPMKQFDPWFVIYGISLSIGLAVLSWHFFERPFLKLKDRISNYRGKAELVAASSEGNATG
jgi:peptidoglycan/LPS O-acetylase OafA/YrhL